MPPTSADVDAFVADKSPNAYEKLVDRLLASPAYGERMAVEWLDGVRYADSIGYHSDNPMNVAPYREYVIRAFNANKHFDQFTLEQLAGDLLPNATMETKVASAYNRLLQTTEEGGAQAKEYEAKNAADRVRNASTVWLGSTMGCAECHNHKFDPFLQKDFYSFAAFFADVQEAAIGRRETGMPVLNEEMSAELKRLEAVVAEARKKLDAPMPELAAARVEWEKQLGAPVEWTVLNPLEISTTNGTTFAKQVDDGSTLVSGTIPSKEKYTVKTKTNVKDITAFRLEALPDPSLPAKGVGASPNGNFVLTEFKVKVEIGNESRVIKLEHASADFSQDGFSITNAIDGKNDTGWAILPQVGNSHTAIFEAKTPIGDENEKTLILTLEFQSVYAQHQIGKFRLAVTTSANPVGGLSLPENIRKILAIASDQRNDKQKGELDVYYRGIAPLLTPLRDEVAVAEKRYKDFLDTAPKVLVSTSGLPRTVRIKPRGNWLDDSGEVVHPALPRFLATLEKKDRATRLDLAQWIVSRENPLTARVYVNRLWKLFFGAGLARPLDDFGLQGEKPSHPELLDWLAVEFMESGWDVKHIVRLMVTSATYRQTSTATKPLRERDPYNRLLARQSSFRLDAEFVRDNALAVSGLLVEKVGGKSVFPYQPAGYWAALNFPTREWQNDKGENLYRRGLYTHWQRTFLHPSLYAFDACTREEATVERQRSNTPLQALVLLNDPIYVEAARVFAESIIREGGATSESRIQWAYRRALSRPAKPTELQVLAALYQKHLAEFSADKPAAQKLVDVGDWPVPQDIESPTLAAWTSVARAILNLHETITRN